MKTCPMCMGPLTPDHVCHGNGSMVLEIERLRAEVERLKQRAWNTCIHANVAGDCSLRASLARKDAALKALVKALDVERKIRAAREEDERRSCSAGARYSWKKLADAEKALAVALDAAKKA